MKRYRILAGLCLVCGLAMGGLTAEIARTAPERAPVILRLDPAVQETARAFLDRVSQGQPVLAGELLQGQPVLTVPEENEADPGWLLWRYYYDHVTYTLEGEPYAGQGLRQDAVVTVPDLDHVTERIGVLAPQLLKERVESAESMSEIYDEKNSYRKDLTDRVLLEAARLAMAEPVTLKEEKLSLQLVFEDGLWRVRPEKSLMKLLSGAVEKG